MKMLFKKTQVSKHRCSYLDSRPCHKNERGRSDSDFRGRPLEDQVTELIKLHFWL